MTEIKINHKVINPEVKVKIKPKPKTKIKKIKKNVEKSTMEK